MAGCLLKCFLAVSRARTMHYRPPSSPIGLWGFYDLAVDHDHAGPINPVMAAMNLAVGKVTFKVSGGIVFTLWECFH